MSEKGTSGRVVAHFDAPQGRTRLARLACVAPLKIAKPFPQPDGSLHVCLMDVSPGLLAGDRYELQWHLAQGAQVSLSHQGFMRVHPSKEAPTSHQQSITIAQGALLEYEAAPILLYRDAALDAHTAIEVEQGGTLLFSEIVCAGRTAHNESFAFDRYQSRLSAHYANELVAWNSVDMRPALHDLRARGAWDENTHYGTLLIIAEDAKKALQESLRSELRALEAEITHPLRGGVGLYEHHAITISLLATRAHDLEQAFKHLRNYARRILIHNDPT